MEKYFGAENYPGHSPFFAPTKLVLLVSVSISATEAEESGVCQKRNEILNHFLALAL